MSDYPNIPVKSAAANLAPFQLSTLPTLDCRLDIELELNVTTTSHGSFIIPLTLRPGCDPGTGPCLPCPDQIVSGQFTSENPIVREILLQDGQASVCDRPKKCPGSQTVPSPVSYTLYGFQNGASNACVGIRFRSREGLYSAVYRDAFDPRDPCLNYVADAGAAGDAAYEFEVQGGEIFLVAVVATRSDLRNPDYTLEVRGGSCVPWLDIEQAKGDTVVLSWPTFATEYQLESTGSLNPFPPPRWFPQGPQPVALDGQFVTTNNIGALLMRYYRLRKP
jgi:hypothetical protein